MPEFSLAKVFRSRYLLLQTGSQFSNSAILNLTYYFLLFQAFFVVITAFLSLFINFRCSVFVKNDPLTLLKKRPCSYAVFVLKYCCYVFHTKYKYCQKMQDFLTHNFVATCRKALKLRIYSQFPHGFPHSLCKPLCAYMLHFSFGGSRSPRL